MRITAIILSVSVAVSAAAIDMNHLYMVGPAATDGIWTADLPEEMVSIGYGTFIRDGYLGEGEFKFLNVLGNYNSSLVADEADKRVYDGQTYRLIDNSAGQNNPDYKFYNPEAGDCRIIARLADSPMTITVRRPALRLVGSAVRGWGDPALAIPVFADDNGTVEWTGILQPGEMKFLTGTGWTPCYNAPVYNTTLTDGTHTLALHDDGTDDHKFIVPRAGRYTLKFSLVRDAATITVTSHEGPSLAGGFTAAPGRYIVAADGEGRHLYFGAVPTRLFISSLDGEVTPLETTARSGATFSGKVYMEADNYYKLYSREDCAAESCLSPSRDVSIADTPTSNIAPMHGNSYTVPVDGYYNVTADFSGALPSLSARLTPSGLVDCATSEQTVSVGVQGREITVSGNRGEISVADLHGRVISTSARTAVLPGIYVVTADSQTFKILVR